MYDIDTKNVAKGKKFFSIFLLVGILFALILGGIYVGGIVKKNSLDSKTTSTRVEITSHEDDGSTLYSPIYYYEVNGVEYSCTSNSSSSFRPGTENKPVYYDSKNPARCMNSYSTSSNNILLIAMILPLIFVAIAVFNMRKISKRIALIKELNQTGKLVKNLPYRLEDTGMSVNDVPIQRPVVDYTLPNGAQVKLLGDPRHDKKKSDDDGFVDLVIDEANPDNYFIDFEINRLSGNQPSDYYNDPNGQAVPYGGQNNPNQNMPDSYVNGAPVMNNPQPVPAQPTMPQQQYDSVTGQPIYPNMPK